MESSKLNTFLRSVSSWPHNLSELHQLGNRFQELLNEMPLQSIWIPSLGITGAKPLSGSQATDSAETKENLFLDFIKQQISSAYGVNQVEPHQIKQVQLREKAIKTDNTFIDHLTFTPIITSLPSSISALYATQRTELGWLIVGSNKTLNGKNELLILAAALYLSGLAGIDKFENAIRARDQFLSVASHELKTPLTSIYGILQLQERIARQDNHLNQQKQRSFLRITIRQVERLNELIDDLLDVSRIQNGRFSIDPTDADVSTLFDEVVSSRLKVIAEEANVKIQTEFRPEVKAWVDPVRFQEVVTNLGMNAIRFSPQGGVIWMKLQPEEEFLLLQIRDQGPSLPASDQTRIFEPFEKAERTSRLGGLGLGLYISRQIAQLHGGTVVLAESVVGKGNLFEARFPLKKQYKPRLVA